MSLYTRYFQKLFGSSAAANRIAEYGSLANGSPVSYSGATATPAEVQALSNYNEGLDGSLVAGATTPIQDLNGLFFNDSYQLAYLMQQGVAEYDSSTVYNSNSLVMYGSVVYKSMAASQSGHTPGTGSPWTVFLQAPNYQVSSSCGTFTTSSTTVVAVTNLSVALTCSGQLPVKLSLQDDGSLTGGLTANGTNVAGNIYFYRNGSFISSNRIGLSTGASVALLLPPTLAFEDTAAPAGSNTYDVRIVLTAGTTVGISNCVLVAKEQCG